MAQRIQLPSQLIPVGSYVHEILAPTRANGARVTLTRTTPWPVGDVLTYRIYERERNGTLQLLVGATESGQGADFVGKDGTVNPPLAVQLNWGADRDRDLIRFELDVLQSFTTGITVEFI